VVEKKKADSLYGKSFWTPQLLYIEAVYHVKQKDDSAAINVLGNIVSLYPKAPLKAKAERMIEVLGRRKEIEEYLTNLQVTRISDDSVVEVNNRKAMVRNDSNLIVSPKFNDSVIRKEALIAKTDSATKQLTYEPLVSGPYTLNLTVPHFVIMVFDKVDATYINESKNALGRYATDYFREAGISVAKDTVNKENALLIFSLFPNAEEALNFLTKIQKAAPEEISWLPANKYSFLLIDEDNLQRMKNTKDIAGYRNLLLKQYPGKIK
jgi:hypothetical protein